MAGLGRQVRAEAGEAALVQRSQQGDRRALEMLLGSHDGEVLNMANRLLGNLDDAHDIRQQAYIKVCRSIDAFDGRSAFRTWLLRIVVNQCRDYIRRRAAERRRADGWSDRAMAKPAADSPGAQCAADERWQRVADAVGRLSPAQREVLVLRHYHDMTLTAAAELLGIPLSTASSRLSGAMNALRGLLSDGETNGRRREEGVHHAL